MSDEETRAEVVESPATEKKRRNGSAAGATAPAPAATVGAASPLFQRKEIPATKETDAHFVWEEILQELAAKGRHPSEIVIHVTRVEPPPEMPLGSFPGDAVAGGADDLWAYMANYFHAKSPSRSGPALYRLTFRGRGSTYSRRADLRMPAPDEMVHLGPARAFGMPGAMNQPAGMFGVAAPPAALPPSPYGYGPPPAYRQDIPAFAPPQPAVQQPAQPASPTVAAAPGQPQDPVIADLRAQVGYLSGQLNEVLKALQEGRAPQAVAPAPPPVPAVPQHLRDTIQLLQELGLINPQTARAAQGVGAAPAPAPAQAPTVAAAPVMAAIVPHAAPQAALTEAATAVKTLKALKGLAQEIESLFGHEAVEEEPASPNLPIVEEPETKEALPFHVIPIPEVTLGGHPVAYARSKETGKIDLEGVMFSNPVLAEKVLDLGTTLVKAMAKMSGIKGAEEVVPEVSRTVGAAPQQQQLPASPPPQAPQAPAQPQPASGPPSWPTL